MSRFRFLVLNGPNLGFLGRRRPEVYGSEGMDQLPDLVDRLLGPAASGIELQFFQSNSEGGLIDRMEAAWRDKTDGIVLNAGAYTHTSLAIADCVEWIGIPTVEVHLSNIFARDEAIRHQSLLGRVVVGVISGFGLLSYALAVRALYDRLSQP